jgi:glucans biosynthesis protein
MISPLSSALAASNPTASHAFSYDRLVRQAQRLAARPYVPPRPRYDELLNKLSYQAFTKIRTRPGHELWQGTKLPFAVEFFHLDDNTRLPVEINIVKHGRAHRLAYDPRTFIYPDSSLAGHLPHDLGYGGFRLHDQRSDGHEWLAFKGASYFRSPGTEDQYGLSARGIAVDTGMGGDESFPRFTRFWLYKPAPGDDAITICALLEGDHLTGAYRMRCRRPGDVIMDIESRLFQRKSIERLGVAPLTSMFWFSETNARRGDDWRPEVHDSDGLAIATGAGERIWRALDNPPRPDYSAFSDHNPRGFGLLQRDRVFDHYQDSAVSFERRPSAWIEPHGDWGKGSVGLFELSTNDEIYDNINAFWVPEKPAIAGTDWRFDYRLYWTDHPPFPPAMARVAATRTGRAGKPGNYKQQKPIARKFVIDFEGAVIAGLKPETKLSLDVSTSSGNIVNPYVIPVGTATHRWRAFFDWTGDLPAKQAPVVLQAVLRDADHRTLSETWVYSYYPRALPA